MSAPKSSLRPPVRYSPRRNLLLPALPFLTGLWIVSVADVPARPPGEEARTEPRIRTAAAVRQSTIEEGAAIRPVILDGVVTFAHRSRREFFLHDASGEVAVGLADERLQLPMPGDRVTLSGFTEPGPRLPLVRADAITIQGRTSLPTAPEIAFTEAMRGGEEHQWVALRGRLLQAEPLGSWLRLTLAAEGGEFSVSIPTTARSLADVGSTLRISGVCNLWTLSDSGRIAGVFLFAPSLAEVQVLDAVPTDASATLTQVAQVRRLQATVANVGHPVALRGVVTFVHPDRRTFYLSDDADGVLMWLADQSGVLPHVGDLLTVRGCTSAEQTGIGVRADQLETTGSAALPLARPISIEEAITGAQDGQWVEMRGHLRQVDAGGGWIRLYLTTTAGEITASIPHPAPLDAKVGAFLVVRGVCQSWADDQHRTRGFFLYTPSGAELTVAAPPPADPFAVPEESIANLPLYRPQTLEMQQVRITGTVFHHVPGRYVVVGNTSGVVRVYGQGTEALSPGAQIEVVGVPGRQGNRSVLRGAVYRLLGPGPAPAPLPLPDLPPLDPSLEDQLVTISGHLASVIRHPEGTHLLIQTPDTLVEAVCATGQGAPDTGAWRPGSRLAVTGLYVIEDSDNDAGDRFEIEIRSPADVTVLAPPPWWTRGRTLFALGTIATGLLLGLAWVAILRRQVRRQTATIRRQLEKEAVLRQRHSEIVEHASDFIFTTDLDGRLTSVNPAGELMTGYSEAEARTLRIADLVAPEDAPTATAFLAQAGLPPQAPATTVETHFRTREGRLIWVETSVRAMVENGRVTGVLGIARDIAGRKRLEELNRQVQKADSLRRMAAAIAHNFNNQIQAVLMGMEMVKLEIPKEGVLTEILATAERSALQASEIGKLMLTYLGQTRVDRNPVDLAAVCREGLVRPRIHLPKQIVLEECWPETGPTISANPGQVHQILACLLTNATEAIGEQPGTIRITAECVPPEAVYGSYLRPVNFQFQDSTYGCLTVSDTGCGIPAEDLGKILDPFFTTKFPGRGMGLAAAFGIVRAHDGAIAVESQPRHGSVFRIIFPLVVPPAE